MKRAAFGLAIALVGLGLWLWRRAEPRRGSEPAAEAASLVDRGSARAPLEPARGVASEASPATSGAREDVADTQRAPVRGQLVRAEDGEPLAERKLLLLASEGNRVSETLTTDERGAFTSTRAFPRGELRAWVKDPETKATLTKHVARFEPKREALWSVPVPPIQAEETVVPSRPSPGDFPESMARVRARVVDVDGRPRRKILVQFFPEAEHLTFGRRKTNVDGTCTFVLDPGPYRIAGGSPGGHLTSQHVVLARGENDLGDLVLESAGTAFLAGLVMADEGESDPLGLVVVQNVSSGAERSVLTASDYSRGNGIAIFRIEDLPPGRHRVSFHSIDGRAYNPSMHVADAPAEGLLFVAAGGPPRGFRLEIHGPDGLRVPEARVLAMFRGRWLLVEDDGEVEVPLLYEEWLVHAPGCRPARGRFTFSARDVSVDEDGSEFCVLRVDLRSGHGGALQCLDAEGQSTSDFGFELGGGAPLDGVELRADGKLVATSDANGLLVLDAERAPEHIELTKSGWRLLEEREEEGMLQALFARQSP